MLAFRTFEVVRRRDQDLWRPSRRRIGLRDPSFESLVDQALQQEDFSIPHDPIEPADDKRYVRRNKGKGGRSKEKKSPRRAPATAVTNDNDRSNAPIQSIKNR